MSLLLLFGGGGGALTSVQLGGVSLTSESTWRGTKIGMTPKAPFSSTKTVAVGTITRTVGAGAILAGNAAMRAMVTFNTTASVPVANDVMARGYVYIVQVGALMGVKVRRHTGDIYEVTAEFGSNYGTSYIAVTYDNPMAISLGAVRNSATGAITLYQSTDDWGSWAELLKSSSVQVAGALTDVNTQTASILKGDFRDGPWLQVFQAQLSETADINNMDATEVIAWNYGGNLTNSPFNKADKSEQEFGTHITSLVEQNYSRSYLSRTITIGWDMIATSPSQSGTGTLAVGFTYDACPLGPPLAGSVSSSALTMVGYGEFTADSLGYAEIGADGQRPVLRVDLLSPGGTRICSLDNAVITNLTWDLNGPGLIEFDLPADDAKIADIDVAEREVQVWEGPDIIHWGVVVRGSEEGQVVHFQCPGLPWYFTRRVVGTGETNMILNGGFEAGNDYWVVGAYGLEPAASRIPSAWTAYTTPSRSISGSRSLFMSCTNAVVYGIFSYQFFFWNVDPATSPEGDTWNIVAWVYVPAGATGRLVSYGDNTPTGYTGVTLTRHSTTEFVNVVIPGLPTVALPKVIETVTLPIGDDFPKDTWVRMEAPLVQPVVPGTTEWIQVTLGTPIGSVFYDEVSLVRNERLYFNNVDQATIVKAVVEHAQDTSIGKSDLRIETRCPPTGVLRTRIYEYSNHELISDLIDEWPQLFNGIDWSIEITGTTRTFVTYYPMKGARKPKQALVLGKNIASLSIDKDGTQTANSIIVMADGGSGAGQEEALAIDPASLEDGLTLEKVYNATPGSAINSLQAQADRGLRRYRNPVTMPTLTTYEVAGDGLFGKISVGDIVPVYVNNGWATLDGDFRVVSISRNPMTGVLSFTVNPYQNWDLLP